MRIVYDGDCPFCSNYVRLVRLRETVGNVTLINAREHPELAATYEAAGHPLDDGMVVEYQGRAYHGHEAMNLLSQLSEGGGPLNRFFAVLMRDKDRAQRLYPLLRAGRNAVLRALRRRKIRDDI